MTEFRKRQLILYYGIAYLIISIFETFLFTAIIGEWTLREIILNFSIWGLIWLVSMFGYPLFFLDTDPNSLSLDPALSVLAYFIIISGIFLAYQLHVKYLEKKLNKKLTISKLLNLYFPVKKTTTTKSGGNEK